MLGSIRKELPVATLVGQAITSDPAPPGSDPNRRSLYESKRLPAGPSSVRHTEFQVRLAILVFGSRYQRDVRAEMLVGID